MMNNKTDSNIFVNGTSFLDGNDTSTAVFPTWTTVTIAICGVGTMANILVITVIGLSSLRKSVFNVLLVVLALMDNLYLWSVVMVKTGVFGYVIFEPSLLLCRITLFLIYTNGTMSSWLIVLISSERFIAVFYPLKVHIICSMKRTKVAISLLLVLASLSSVPTFFTCSLSIKDGRPNCRIAGPDALRDLVCRYVYCLVYSIIPFCIITVLNTLIAKKIIIQRMFRQNHNGQSGRQLVSTRDMSLIAMTFVVSAVFIASSLPATVLVILNYSCRYLYNRDCIANSLSWGLVYISDDVNHSVNFFLYCMSGSFFRNSVSEIFSCKKRNLSRYSLRDNVFSISQRPN